MGIIADMMRKEEKAGYSGANLTAKVSQDIVLEAIDINTVLTGLMEYITSQW